MSDISLNKVKQFESLIIKCLIIKYGSNLPQNKIELLNSSNFITPEMINGISTSNEIQGTIIREIIKNVIDITCEKELIIDGNKISITYGEDLEIGLIEYYSEQLASEYNIKINEIEGLSNNLEMVKKLKDRLDNGLDKMIFESDAIKILDAAGLQELIEQNDNLAIERYVKEKEDILNTTGELEQKQLDTINNELSDKSRLQIVYLNGKQHIKYVDKKGEVHLIETKDPQIISKAYKEKMTSFKSSNVLDVDDFFEELKDINDEIELKPLEDKDLDTMTSQEIDMLDFVHSNKKITEKANDEKITHSEDSTIHVIEATNEIVTTEKKYEDSDIKSKIIANDVTGLNANGSYEYSQEVTNNDERIISREEAQGLYDRFNSGEKLTLDELRALRTYEKNKRKLNQEDALSAEEIAQMQIEDLKQIRSEESGYKLVPKYYGYVRGILMVYILIVSGCIGLVLGTLLFRIMN